MFIFNTFWSPISIYMFIFKEFLEKWYKVMQEFLAEAIVGNMRNITKVEWSKSMQNW